MKVILSADAIRFPLTGIGRYTYELARRLPEAEAVKEILYHRTGLLSKTFPERPNESPFQQSSQRVRQVLAKSSIIVRGVRKLQRTARTYQLKRHKDFVYHGPNYYLPIFEGPCVCTIHDLSIFMWPECHPKERVKILREEIPLSLQRASVILTDSEFTKKEVASYFNWPENRIVAAPLAASPVFHQRTNSEIALVVSKWNLTPKRYALYVGTLDPRKNIDLILTAYERMADGDRLAMPLIVAGFKGWKSENTIARLRKGADAGWATYLGFVSEADLPVLYSGARVFLFPSLYEGFGLPVLEAMASGVPVICSNASSLPEVVGESAAAFMVDPDDIDQFCQTLDRAINDDEWCNEAAINGVGRAKQFTWEKTVAATLSAYKLASS